MQALEKHKLYLFGLVAVLLVCAVFTATREMVKKPRLEIVFLDVGQGDATLITTPLGKQILIDAGSLSGGVTTALAKYTPVSDRTIEMVVLTHPDLDHVGGMVDVLDEYHVEMVMHSGLLAGSDVYSYVGSRIMDKNIPLITAHVGQVVNLEPGVSLHIYSPYDGINSMQANDHSVVMKLVYGERSVLLMGDATKYIENDLVSAYGKDMVADILKVGHHGSQTSTSSIFLDIVQPQYGVISAGCGNRFGHPHAEVLVNLISAEVQVFDTCHDGDVMFVTDGNIWRKE